MMLPRNRMFAGRLAAVIVSLGLFTLAASRVDPDKLIETLVAMRPAWFLSALLLNGVLFMIAALRWHLVLRLTGNAVAYPATLRTAFAGHFFYVGLFGAVGGDSARSVYYSRWFKRPLAAVLATAPLDRLLGLAGLLIFGTVGVLLAVQLEGLRNLRYSAPRNPLVWLLVPVILAILWWAARKAVRGSFLRELAENVAGGVKRLANAPGWTMAGVGCGILVQGSLSGILALNLEAVSAVDIQWTRLVWTLPLISLLGGLPVTVAGLGTREAAAIALLGLYGVPGETAMAASLLCLASTLSWALFGAAVFWREDRARAQQ
jgi:glycosyltransferase 2 family protein